MRDRFVCGVRSEAIQNKLLTEANLTMKRAQEVAQSIESARDFKFGGSDSSARPVEDVHKTSRATLPGPDSAKPKRCSHW